MKDAHDCAPPPGNRKSFSKDEAIAFLRSRVEPLGETEHLGTNQALGRVLAEPVTSRIQVPGWDNSAMDGYAIRHADLAACKGRLRVSQRIPAGSTGQPLEPGTAARIFTGAPVPQGTDTVVIQEICEPSADQVIIPLDCKAGANIRRAGEDIQAGAEVMAAGVKLTPQHLGLAASVGVERLRVYQRLKVAIFSSGDELVMPGQPLGAGQIYNSNRFSLLGLLQGWGCEVIDLGIVTDSLEATIEALRRGAEQADLIIASGGVSVGEEDHIKPAVEQLGTLDLCQVAIRPGKPVAFGWVQGTPFFGSPGNPVSLFVTLCLFARPLVRRMQGIADDPGPHELRLPAGFDWPRPDKRMEFHRARLEPRDDGTLEVAVYPSRSSAVLSSVAWADGFVQLQPGEVIKRGDRVAFIPFAELLH
ncbi:molybdopterin molybdotransferase MoeA [Thiorhodococcus mannitoliphagus]|uniref:Molybdopterin molybdenumtransferase n=1 Tax=Thiorhodococcus mannitoliphagus TaxID=329406 RepID=A0A6P1E0E8_9GAMM|nr:gephyrin-like molybdotransferase Glp [Thiorhodococcus mannitoliphagus]NEX21474.1 molybdopterin molybdotransferase MoeA [Thiorhodococcus mannitoliphagus]